MRALPGALGSHVDESVIVHGQRIPIFVEPIRGKIHGSAVNIQLRESSGKHKRSEKPLRKSRPCSFPQIRREKEAGRSFRMEFQRFGGGWEFREELIPIFCYALDASRDSGVASVGIPSLGKKNFFPRNSPPELGEGSIHWIFRECSQKSQGMLKDPKSAVSME